MKRLPALILALAMLFSLAACSGEAGSEAGQQSPGGEGEPLQTGSYESGCDAYETVTDALSVTFDTIVEAYNSTAGEDDYIFELFLPFMSIDMAFTYACGSDGWQSALELLLTDAEAEQTDEHTYRITYTGSYIDPLSYESVENVPHEMRCAYDAATGAVQFYETAQLDGERKLVAFVEFQPLGGNRYALQSKTERAVVEYDGEQVLSFTYSRCPADIYTPEADSIFRNSTISDAWVTQIGAHTCAFTLSAQELTLWYAAAQTEYAITQEQTIVIQR